MTPILEHQRAQSEINMKIIQALDQILVHLTPKQRVRTAAKEKTK